jgi:hypothetical protein
VIFAISQLPRLDNIHLRCFVVICSDVEEEVKTEGSPSFRGTLTLASHTSYEHLVTNLLGFSGGMHFSCLNLAVLRYEELPSIRKLMDACSRTTTSLHLTLDLGKPLYRISRSSLNPSTLYS